MHYFIDGYNLLFSSLRASKNLQEQREALIEDIAEKSERLRLSVTLVFDATKQEGFGSRSHYHSIEIIYTPQGISADDLIISKLKRSPHPRQETLITSDNQLAWRARRLGVHTQGVKEFLQWLNHRYEKRQQQQKRPKEEKEGIPPSQKVHPTAPSSTSSSAPSAASMDYYLNAFEKRFQQLEEEDKREKEAKRRQRKKKKPR